MKVERREGSVTADVLTGMIVSAEVLGQVAPRWPKEGAFGQPWANIVGQWCVEFWQKYGTPPNKAVKSLFEDWRQGKDEDTVAALETFLSQLSGRYERAAKDLVPAQLIDRAGKLFNRVKVERAIEAMQADLEANKVEAAVAKMSKFDRVMIGQSAVVDFFHSPEVAAVALKEARESIIKYPGALGEFFGDSLERDGFVAFIGPMKRGKTFWLLDLAWRAVLQRRRVFFVQAGDLSRNQMIRRFLQRALNRPLKATDPNRPVRWPKEITLGEEDADAMVEFEERRWAEGISERAAKDHLAKILKTRIKSADEFLKIGTYPTSSVSVDDLRAEIDAFDRKGWRPDAVVIDYADILKPTGVYSESRDGVNATWKGLRRMSQELHGLVVTATQGNAASFKADRLDMNHFSEDNRKLAQVSGMIGINQTTSQKINQVQRLNWIVRREDESDQTKEVWVGQCLACANPAVVSVY